MPIGSSKQKFIQLGIETYFSLNSMPQTVKEPKHSIEEGWLKKINCMVIFHDRYVTCFRHNEI